MTTTDPSPLPAENASSPADPRPRRVWRRLLLDRTAVLMVGLCAGFAVGLSFAPSVVSTPGVVPDTTTAPPPPAATQQATRGIDPRVIARVRRTGKLRVGVLGDSFGMGVWDALYRLLPADQGYDVLRLSHEAAGFTRYRADDLEVKLRRQLAAQPIDAAVICLGVNDAAAMWEGKLYQFMDAGWQRIVGERVDRYVALARSTGARVYWVGLPAMRDPALDAKVQALNAFFAARMRRLGVDYFPTRALSVDKAGRYTAHLPDAAGTPRLMRTGDGVHMIGIGYQRVAAKTVAAVEAYDRQVRAAVVAGGAAR